MRFDAVFITWREKGVNVREMGNQSDENSVVVWNGVEVTERALLFACRSNTLKLLHLGTNIGEELDSTSRHKHRGGNRSAEKLFVRMEWSCTSRHKHTRRGLPISIQQHI